MKPIDSTSGPARPKGTVRGWLREWWSRLVAGLALAAVAGVTGRISYLHIKALTLALHQPAQVAQIMPFGVDGLIVVGSVVLLQAAPNQEWLGWLGIGPGVAASLFANWESGIRYGWLAAAWATVPAIAFAVATFMFERWLKEQFPAGGHAGELTTAEALEVLLSTDTERAVAEALGIERSHVQRWKRQLARLAETGAPELALNGAAS